MRTLGSVYLTVAVLFILGVAAAAATVIEAAYGTPAAQALVYKARWFEVLLGLAIVNLIAMFLLRWPYRKSQTGFVLTHLAIIWILVSAGITRYFGYEGVMTIREGAASDFMYSRETYLQMQIGQERAASKLDLWKAGAQNDQRHFIFSDGTYDVSVVDYWPHATESLVAGDGGSPAIDLTLTSGGHRHRETLWGGESMDEGGVTVALHDGPLPTLDAVDEYGTLDIELAGDRGSLAVPSIHRRRRKSGTSPSGSPSSSPASRSGAGAMQAMRWTIRRSASRSSCPAAPMKSGCSSPSIPTSTWEATPRPRRSSRICT
ncbi:MAG: hypothetical protein R3E12_02035 [Candidatus Eisenbacteria bacterium]